MLDTGAPVTDLVSPTALLEQVARYLTTADVEAIRRAFEFARDAHDGQRLGDRQRVRNVRLAGLARLSTVGVARKLEGAPDRLHIPRRYVTSDLLEERGGGDQSGGRRCASIEHVQPFIEYSTSRNRD